MHFSPPLQHSQVRSEPQACCAPQGAPWAKALSEASLEMTPPAEASATSPWDTSASEAPLVPWDALPPPETPTPPAPPSPPPPISLPPLDVATAESMLCPVAHAPERRQTPIIVRGLGIGLPFPSWIVPNRGRSRFDSLQDGASVLEKCFARREQPHASRRSLEQAGAELVFQAANLPAEWRL
jgi:hypothetical protein